ncbi:MULTISPECIES: hypothetical protein [Amycolatopsis]|uniref:Uncharacterized protein n=1 Tax=Amycolatopsis thermalba TaxID=944492 RepID=A0ABY4NYZ1_9PSEU|nr:MULTISPECIES: hypothetical protein [Amycolatopsis]OXM75128.1 hypothetical protein CF166_00595 [Amycolatopsis sp. KNN50.9b]UQS25266.1 hypothetical protein L1857_21870 [Amycolatopsis thermalba]
MPTTTPRLTQLTIVVSAQLMAEFDDVDADEVSRVVRESVRDLSGRIASEAVSELLHRLAHHRLTRLIAAGRPHA